MRSALRQVSSASTAGCAVRSGSSRHDLVSGHVDADPGEQLAHLSRVAQVDVGCARHEVADDVVAAGPLLRVGGGVVGARADPLGDQLFGHGPVERKSAGSQRHGEQVGRRLGPGRQLGQRRVARQPSPVGQPGQRRPLRRLRDEGQRRPAGRPQCRRRRRLGPFGAQVAVRAHRVVGVTVRAARVHRRQQVELAGARQRVLGQAAHARPHLRRVVAAPAVEEPVHRGEVPAPGGAQGVEQRRGRGTPRGPPDPARRELGGHRPYDVGLGRGADGPDREGPVTRSQPDPAAIAGHRKSDGLSGCEADRAQRRHHLGSVDESDVGHMGILPGASRGCPGHGRARLTHEDSTNRKHRCQRDRARRHADVHRGPARRPQPVDRDHPRRARRRHHPDRHRRRLPPGRHRRRAQRDADRRGAGLLRRRHVRRARRDEGRPPATR